MDRISEAVKTIFTNRRGWVVLVPAISAGAAVFGIAVPEEALLGFGENVTTAVMSGLALWSLFSPRS